jgi:branched-chain amino acid transport system permease protein
MSDSRPGPMVTALSRRGRWGIAEILFWVVAVAAMFLFPERLLFLNEIAVLALFAVSLDLILGYAGIISLGHGAFFGLGAYAAGLLAKHATADPLIGLLVAAVAAALLGFVTSFLVLRGADLTKLMVTLGIALLLYEAANQAAWLTGGADGLQGVTINPLFGMFEFDLFGRTAYAYSLAVTFLLFAFARRLVVSPFGLSLCSIRDNPLRARAIGIPANRRLVVIYTVSAAYAGVAGALLAQTTQFVSLDVLSFQRSADVLLVLVIGGVGYLYGGLIGAVIFKVVQDLLAEITPQYWQFWIGLVLVVIVMVGPERFTEGTRTFWSRLAGRLIGRPPQVTSARAREL